MEKRMTLAEVEKNIKNGPLKKIGKVIFIAVVVAIVMAVVIVPIVIYMEQ